MKRLQIQNVSKSFDGLPALQDIDLELSPGEIHGLIGVNGSGKSTLLNILSGAAVIRQSGGFSGRIRLQGRPYAPKNPRQAAQAGVAVVHQSPALLKRMAVWENVLIGREAVHAGFAEFLGRDLALLERSQNRAQCRKILQKLGFAPDPAAPVGALPAHQQPILAAAEALSRANLKLLLLDEPTALAGAESVSRFHDWLRHLAAQGVAVLYVSHRLHEIRALCDRITILRHGRIVGRLDSARQDPAGLGALMIGRELLRTRKTLQREQRQTLLELRGFSVALPDEALREVNLEIRQKEILGLAGLSGHGKSALAPGLMGLHPATGEVRFEGRPLPSPEPLAMIRRGIYFIPDDPGSRGLLQDHAVYENILFGAVHIKGDCLRRFPIPSLGLVDRRRSRTRAAAWVRDLDIQCRSLKQKTRELSGGNQQKVCLARALALNPKLLLVHEPTMGVDIQAKERILDLLLKINAEQNVTLAVASSDLDELRRVCDRIAVFHEGRLSAVLAPDCSEEDLARAFTGERNTTHEPRGANPASQA